MKNFRGAFLCFFVYSLPILSQNATPELQKFSKETLFNLRDTTCVDLSGEWLGEEVQYDPTGSFVKFKFKVVLQLSQHGNRISGSSYIEDKFRGSYGAMKIRGMVIEDKFHFEEYEIMDEKFYQPGVVWCLRSGVMSIKTKNNKVILEGLDYSGYSSDNYSECTDYAKMSVVSNSGKSSGNLSFQDPAVVSGISKIPDSKKMDLLIFPNPTMDDITISYLLTESTKVTISIYNLAGALIQTVIDEQVPSGNHQLPCDLSTFVPGVYLVRLYTSTSCATKQIVKTR